MGASGASGARRSILLLVSSMSAGGRSVRLGPRIVRILRGGGWEVAVRLTTPGDDPAAIAGGVVAGSIVAALGGDGYLSAVARGCHESDAIFAPLPGGRGNDLCRALGIGTDPLARADSQRAPRLDVRRGRGALLRFPDLPGASPGRYVGAFA